MRGAAALALALVLGGAALAQPLPQPLPTGVPDAPILMLDDERLFTGSAFGRRVLAGIAAAEAALAAENRALEEELLAAERDLTARRAGMEPEAFRAEADAFDARVQAVRARQDARARDILRRRDAERQRFLEAAVPVLGEIARAAGAVAILRRDAVVLSFDRIDITDAAIERLDGALGDGAAAGGD